MKSSVAEASIGVCSRLRSSHVTFQNEQIRTIVYSWFNAMPVQLFSPSDQHVDSRAAPSSQALRQRAAANAQRIRRRAAAKGTMRKAEVHWYEASGIGKKEFKIKRFVD